MKTRSRHRPAGEVQKEYFEGVRTIPYDLVKELVYAMLAILVLVFGLSAFLGSPDVKPETLQSWSTNDPVDFVTTAVTELDGSSFSSSYGPPYNDGTGALQGYGPFTPQAWFGVHEPVDSAHDFVLTPLQVASAGNTDLASALEQYRSADDKTRSGWLEAYGKALGGAQVDGATHSFTIAQGDYGPLPVMMQALLTQAQSGGLDGQLLNQGAFYQTDFTKPLLFMGDGGYLSGLADQQKLNGDQWGMMNETGSYPGQTWLWLYTFWYQVPPFAGTANADLDVVLTMGVLSLLLMLVPFLPVVRDIPYWVPVHRLIWRARPPAARR